MCDRSGSLLAKVYILQAGALAGAGGGYEIRLTGEVL
jgi:hypothetical protein